MSPMTLAGECQQYVEARSWRARQARGTTRQLVGVGVAYLRGMPDAQVQALGRDGMRKRLTARLREEKPKSIIAAIFLQVLIGIIAKLIVEWWWNRRQNR